MHWFKYRWGTITRAVKRMPGLQIVSPEMRMPSLMLCGWLTAFIIIQLMPSFVPALAAGGENAFDPRTVLDGLISTCGLIILVAGGALGVRLFFNGQMVQAVVAVLIAAFVFTLLNTSALTDLGAGLKNFIWAGDSVAGKTN